MRKKQEINIILHYPRTRLGLHQLVRHAVAVKELIDQDMAGTLEGSLSARVHLLDAASEEEALIRYIKRHPPKKTNNLCGNQINNSIWERA